MTKGYDVVPQLSDDIQLTVDEYRKKLYEVNCFTFVFLSSGKCKIHLICFI